MGDNARTVLEKRYLRRGPDGLPAETIPEMFWRVARFVAAAEEELETVGPKAEAAPSAQDWAEEFYKMMTEFRFLPNSPTFTGAGTPLGQLAACFVLPIEDDMGRSSAGIFQTLRDAALVQQTGGGNGFAFSRLRPAGATVQSTMGGASGPIGFLQVYDRAFGEIAQGGSRRGANMAVLRVDHPDIRAFINCKAASEHAITNFNISVGLTEKFMRAVEEGGDFELVAPGTGASHGHVNARELFHEIAVKAHHNGEPGVLFLDEANRTNPVPHLYELEATNPCVTGDTVVMTTDGPQRVDSLLGKKFSAALETGAHESTEAGFFRTGKKDVYDLTLTSGHRLRLTEDHQVLVRRDGVALFVEAGKAQANDEVCLARTRGISWGERVPQRPYEKAPPGLRGDDGIMIASSSSELAKYIRGIFDADGYVHGSHAGDASIRLARTPLDLLEFMQSILMAFGVNSTICEKQQDMHADDNRTQHELVISNDNIAEFAARIGFRDLDKALRLESINFGALYEDKFASKIKSLVKAGTEDVYDCTIPGVHRFSANGMIAHNCGEQWLGPYESCCLGSVNLARHVAGGGVDWARLADTVRTATRFLDDVVTANNYVPAVPQLKAAAERCRRIGLGIMGLADAMFHCGVRYGSASGIAFGAQVMAFVRYHTMSTSIALARTRGRFPAFEGSIYDPATGLLDLAFPGPEVPPVLAVRSAADRTDFGRPDLDWARLRERLLTHGIRNAAQTTVAPTGTISTIAGCEGYGCEPVFALAYTRNVRDGDGSFALNYVSPELDAALERAGLEPAVRAQAMESILETGTCQSGAAAKILPAAIRDVFVTSGDITPTEHILQQAALQHYVDNSISKTINMPNESTVIDVEKAYLLAWRLGCKGLTVYRTGSRNVVVLETKKTLDEKKLAGAPAASGEPEPSAPKRKRRPVRLEGSTFRVATPLGVTYVTVNDDVGSSPRQPFEVFLQASKAGSDTAAVTEALGRLISQVLRMASPVPPRDRLEDIVRQLQGIGGQRSLGLGPKKVRSLPDGIAQMLREYLSAGASDAVADGPAAAPRAAATAIGDLCPECGQATYVYAEGCKKCASCGLSEC